jgi:DnaJ-class molecular chaperone
VLGAKIECRRFRARAADGTKGHQLGAVFRLKGKVRNTTTGNTGDQLVSVRIVLPETIDSELSYFMSEWRQKHAYNPGRSADLAALGVRSVQLIKPHNASREAAFPSAWPSHIHTDKFDGFDRQRSELHDGCMKNADGSVAGC